MIDFILTKRMYSSILFSCLLCHFGVVIVSANQIGLYYYEALVMILQSLGNDAVSDLEVG